MQGLRSALLLELHVHNETMLNDKDDSALTLTTALRAMVKVLKESLVSEKTPRGNTIWLEIAQN